MSARHNARTNARRIVATVQRIESQPYPFAPGRRVRDPRGTGGHFWCELTGTIAAAAGAIGSRSPGTLASQTVYDTSSGTDTALAGTYTIKNWWPTTFAASKITLLLPGSAGTFDVAEQAC